ncbi:family 43 glycosylhydrolase [Microbacterium hominis]|uniref:family 43 glycosylhydrolase n=1 Tax=Microbacterium TaxID=33882 RepID=UPI00168B41B9|nr:MULTISPECIES: family 43 glycosylhydrolase [Microbacterium]QOC24463.1 family 43 glycosylhydrolase [Microbacterium hominis]QOC28537.1 family 43 glycosylhydrolase [Microbacterium hominis]QYF96256.1 family 43 glycosylhydrolase [Microbacterium sp. PAMC21962]
MTRTTPRIRILAAATTLAMSVAGVVGLAAPATAATGLVAHYPLDDTSGTVARDASGNARDGRYVGGPTLTGGEGVRLDGVDDHVALPANLLAGLTSITISADVLIRGEQGTPYFIYGFGNTDAGGVGNGYLFSSGNGYRASIASGNWSTEQTVSSGQNLPRDVWKTIAYTLDDATDTARLYLDGVQVAQQSGVTLTPASIGGGLTAANVLGKSVYTADRTLAGSLRDVRIYDHALTSTEAAALAPSDDVRVARDRAALALGDLGAVTSDLTLPTTGPNGSQVAWASSDPAVITPAGAVTRPAAGSAPAAVTLTATITRGAASATRAFAATVSPAADATARAQQDLDALSIPDAQDIRGNITLPAAGAVNGSTIAWSASPAGIITTTAQAAAAAGVVTRGATSRQVTLTATVPGTSAVRSIDVTVTAAPQNLDTDYSAGYLWTHFATSGGYEKIFFGHSTDGLHWSKLNDDKPILANLAGDLGVRDPHLVRSPEGDKYWIIGTDLHAEGGGAGGSGWDQLNASKNLVVWESTDLVTWSDQRIVFAGFDDAGCVWAPEATYNEATGEYYVYWAARDRTDNGTSDWALRMYLTKTRDFVTFTEPVIWTSLNDKGDGQSGPNIIDSTIAKEGDTYYRFSTSDWMTVVDTATSLDGPWTRVIERGDAAAHGLRASMEGLTVYPLPQGGWAVMGDQNGYYAQTTPSLASLSFTQLSAGTGADQYSFDKPFRHGSVLRLSAAEEARLLAAYGDDATTPEQPQQGPIAQYSFTGGSLADEVGDADLTAHGTATVVDDPDRGAVLRLTGASGGYASFPTGFFDGRDTMTVSLDVKSEKSSGNFFTFAFGTDSTRYAFLRLRGGDVRTAITQNSWTAESAVTGSVSAGQWHRLDLVFDKSTMRVYADGALLGENAALGATVSQLGSDLVGYLGRSLYSADGYFQGAYDNVRVYNRALSQTEILANAGIEDRLLDVSLAQPEALKLAPIVDAAAHRVILPVVKGTDLTHLAPTFTTVSTATVSPASGTTVDLSSPVTYTVTTGTGATTAWTIEAGVVASPVLPGLYADPNIAVFGDTYYIYATSDGVPGWGGNTFYVWSSKNLVDWERSAQPILTLDGVNGTVPWATGNAWAPTIIERAGKYYFYFSGHNPTYDRKTIGVAVADSPTGPFVAKTTAMILNNEAITSGQAIDPAAFHDPVTGKYYLGWGNGSPVLAELSDDMVSIKPGTYQRINGLTDFREGVFFNYRQGLYHLTYSIDDTGSENYRVGYATATSMNGPWTYRGVILQKDLSLGIKGTGHSSIINVPGTDDWYIAYHRFAMPSGDGTHRETTIDRVEFGPDGLMKTITPTLESVAPQTVAVGPRISVSATTRCVAGKVYVTVQTKNLESAAISADVTTAFGSKAYSSIAAGATVTWAISTRAAATTAGTVSVTARSGSDVAAPQTAAYAAQACG